MAGIIQGFVSGDNIDVTPYDNRDDIYGLQYIISGHNAWFANDSNLQYVNSAIPSYTRDRLRNLLENTDMDQNIKAFFTGSEVKSRVFE